MSTKKSIQTRIWTSLLLMVFLVPMLLPASAVSAAPRAGKCGSSVAAAYASLGHSVADNEEVVIPNATVDAAVFAAIVTEELTRGANNLSVQASESIPIEQLDEETKLLRYGIEMLLLQPPAWHWLGSECTQRGFQPDHRPLP